MAFFGIELAHSQGGDPQQAGLSPSLSIAAVQRGDGRGLHTLPVELYQEVELHGMPHFAPRVVASGNWEPVHSHPAWRLAERRVPIGRPHLACLRRTDRAQTNSGGAVPELPVAQESVSWYND